MSDGHAYTSPTTHLFSLLNVEWQLNQQAMWKISICCKKIDTNFTFQQSIDQSRYARECSHFHWKFQRNLDIWIINDNIQALSNCSRHVRHPFTKYYSGPNTSSIGSATHARTMAQHCLLNHSLPPHLSRSSGNHVSQFWQLRFWRQHFATAPNWCSITLRATPESASRWRLAQA